MIKKTSPTIRNKFAGNGIKNQNISNQELGKELHKPIYRKFKKTKVHSPFKHKIRGADLADMQWISKFKRNSLFCYMYLIFSVNIYGLFIYKIKKVLQLLMLFK